jgi:hypothetical protein
MRTHQVRFLLASAIAAISTASISYHTASAAVIFTDGFGDGDRDNSGIDSGATATDPTDVGIPWYLTDGTSAVTFRATDDSAGIGSGNALQLHNTGSNNRPTVGHFPSVSMVDGSKLILRFDARMVAVTTAAGAPTTADRAIRFGLYRDTNGDDGVGDHGSASSVSVDDVGYNARVDAGLDVSNSTSMDVTRDDTPTGTSILQATTTGIGVSSTNAVNQFADSLSHHFELILERSGTSMLVSLQKDSNAAITGTDATPVGFVFDEVALGVRSSAATDMRFDNIEVEYIVPEPASLGMLMFGAAALAVQRRR